MANPLRALIDYIYWHKLDNVDFDFLKNNLRIEPESISKIKLVEINELLPVYKAARVKKFLQSLKKVI